MVDSSYSYIASNAIFGIYYIFGSNSNLLPFPIPTDRNWALKQQQSYWTEKKLNAITIFVS
jgi:hypothetical protein